MMDISTSELCLYGALVAVWCVVCGCGLWCRRHIAVMELGLRTANCELRTARYMQSDVGVGVGVSMQDFARCLPRQEQSAKLPKLLQVSFLRVHSALSGTCSLQVTTRLRCHRTPSRTAETHSRNLAPLLPAPHAYAPRALQSAGGTSHRALADRCLRWAPR